MSVFDIALEKRLTDSGEPLTTDRDAADVFLIKNTQTGTICRRQAGVLASFINSAIAQADILEALEALNAPNGGATLDSGGKVPAAQLPAYVDDALEYATASAFPVAGEAGKLYVALGGTSVTAYLVWVWCYVLPAGLIYNLPTCTRTGYNTIHLTIRRNGHGAHAQGN